MIANVSPRPVLMVNSVHDAYFPLAFAEALFAAAAEPKGHMWLDADHMDIFEPDVMHEITRDVLLRLWQMGVMPPPPESQSAGPPDGDAFVHAAF